jgi:hypothetical protein
MILGPSSTDFWEKVGRLPWRIWISMGKANDGGSGLVLDHLGAK